MLAKSRGHPLRGGIVMVIYGSPQEHYAGRTMFRPVSPWRCGRFTTSGAGRPDRTGSIAVSIFIDAAFLPRLETDGLIDIQSPLRREYGLHREERSARPTSAPATPISLPNANRSPRWRDPLLRRYPRVLTLAGTARRPPPPPPPPSPPPPPAPPLFRPGPAGRTLFSGWDRGHA